MSYRREREVFVAVMAAEGLAYETLAIVLRNAATIQRCAELACSSEAADRDRVACPNPRDTPCLCAEYGARDEHGHGYIPRIAVQSWRAEQRLVRTLPRGFGAVFSGDPRGACVKLTVPSGRTDDWGRTGMCVPTRTV